MESSVIEDILQDRSLEGFEQRSQATDSKRDFVLLKEYVNTSVLSKQDLKHNAMGSDKTVCAYCGEPLGTDIKLTIEDLKTSCHPNCLKCGICSKPMGNLLESMFLRQGKVHCQRCYAKVV